MIEASVVSFLQGNTSGYQIQVAKLDFNRTPPWIWLRRSASVQETTLSGATFGNITSTFDLELVNTNAGQLYLDADNLKIALQSITPSSTVGSSYIQALFVDDHSADYIPFTVLDTDTGLYIVALQLQIFHLA